MSVFEAFMESQIGKKDAEINHLRDANSKLALEDAKLRDDLHEAKLQLGILLDWIESRQTTLFLECCKCENNGDLCEFHAMLDDARKASNGPEETQQP